MLLKSVFNKGDGTCLVFEYDCLSIKSIYRFRLRDPKGRQSMESLLEDLSVPTLIVWGEEDRVLDASGAKILQSIMPNAKAIIMNNVGHVPMVERPEKTAVLYLDFLNLKL